MKNYIFIICHKILFLLLITGITVFAQAQTAPETWTTEATYAGTMPSTLLGVVIIGSSYESVCSSLFSKANADPKNAVLTLEATNPCSIYWTYPINNPPGYRNYKSTRVGISMQCAGASTPYTGAVSATPAISVPQGRTCEFQCKSNLDERYQSTNWCVPKVCPVPPLLPLITHEGIEAERYNGKPPFKVDKLQPRLRDAFNNLEAALAMKGIIFTGESGYRSTEYQKHLREIRDKRLVLNDYGYLEKFPQCAVLAGEVNLEGGAKRHNLGDKVADKVSLHESGNAFDAYWTGKGNPNIDTLVDQVANQFGLWRPWPKPRSEGGDDPHFQFK